MKLFSRPLAIVSIVSLAALAAQLASAQPSGSVTNLVTGATNALWDFSNLTNELQTLDDILVKVSDSEEKTNADFIYGDEFTQDGRGKFSGSANTEVTVRQGFGLGGEEANAFSASYVVSGSVTSAKGVAKIIFTSKLSAPSVQSSGRTRQLFASSTFVLKVDAVAGQVSGRHVLTGRLSGGGGPTRSGSNTNPYGPYPLTNYLAELGNGTWTLVLDFSSPGATVTLNGGTVYPFTFNGPLTTHAGESKLNLKGTGNAAGSMLQVTLDSNNQVSRITGRISGQTVKVSQ